MTWTEAICAYVMGFILLVGTGISSDLWLFNGGLMDKDMFKKLLKKHLKEDTIRYTVLYALIVFIIYLIFWR